MIAHVLMIKVTIMKQIKLTYLEVQEIWKFFDLAHIQLCTLHSIDCILLWTVADIPLIRPKIMRNKLAFGKNFLVPNRANYV